MNCPSEETLFETIDSPERLMSDSAVARHVNECRSCAKKLQAAEQLIDMVASTGQSEIPESAFLAARNRIESHEAHKRHLQFAFAAVAMMLLCLSCLSWFPSTTSSNASVKQGVKSSVTSESHSNDTTASATVSVDSSAIAVPIETESSELSLFIIYPTIPAELSADSTSNNQSSISIARS